MSRNSNRRAVTLVEVLIAIFLMGIGLMAILSLFPLGAAQMAQALQDQRAAEAATTAAAYARVVWKQACDADVNDARMKFLAASETASYSVQPFIMAMDDPNANVPTVPTSLQKPLAAVSPMTSVAAGSLPPAPPATGPSYPVIVDPIGWQSQGSVSTNNQWWAGNQIPRRTLNVLPPGATSWVPISNLGTLSIFKQFSLMDDMTFDFNGTPKGSATTPNIPVERQGRYSWAFMFRRGNNADRTAVDISTILYSGRSIDVASTETAYVGTVAFSTVAAGVTPTTKALALSYSSPKPAIRRGGWILDATLSDSSGNPDIQGIFYRVVNVDDSTPGVLNLELQTPIVGKSNPSVTQTTQRIIIVMDKVVEVFVKKDVSTVAPAMPY
jgi:Tfp pilus assembly protein PilV